MLVDEFHYFIDFFVTGSAPLDKRPAAASGSSKLKQEQAETAKTTTG